MGGSIYQGGEIKRQRILVKKRLQRRLRGLRRALEYRPMELKKWWNKLLRKGAEKKGEAKARAEVARDDVGEKIEGVIGHAESHPHDPTRRPPFPRG